MSNELFLVTENDFREWRQRRAQVRGCWWSCLDAHTIRVTVDTAGTRGAFWPLVVYASVLRKVRMRRMEPHQEWVRVTQSLLPLDAPLVGRTKVAAIETLERAGLIEARRRTVRSAPEVRLLHVPSFGPSESESNGNGQREH